MWNDFSNEPKFSLGRYTQPRGAGVMVATGAKKLLGANDLSIIELLVRESAQNSWDARLENETPRFGVDVRQLSDDQQRILATQVFTDLEDSEKWKLSDLKKSLQDGREPIWVIEISDRGTKGLGGPIDASSAAAEGDPTDFRDLVFSYGATRDVVNGGGTYGYGKTSSFVASSLSTVVYWTRTLNNGRLEDRFIASTLGEDFDADGKAFSGRHWWGRWEDDGICPVIGDDAKLLGQSIFEHGFAEGETGTSILVLAPVLIERENEHEQQLSETEEYEKLADLAARASVRHLWPKMTPAMRDVVPPMIISIRFNGIEKQLGSPETGMWRIWKATLDAVREREGVPDAPQGEPRFECQLWTKRIGYVRAPRDLPKDFKEIATLALNRDIALPDGSLADEVFTGLKETVCFMRTPELVVSYETVQLEGELASYLCGVFKVQNNEIADEAYAAAENPAHTVWNSRQLEGAQKRIIAKGEKDWKDGIKEYIASFRHSDQVEIERFNREVAECLRVLQPSDLSSELTQSTQRVRRGRRKAIKKAQIDGVDFGGIADDGRQIQLLQIRTPSGSDSNELTLTVKPIGEGDSGGFSEESIAYRWWRQGAPSSVPTMEDLLGSSGTVTVPGGETMLVEVRCPARYVVDFSLEV